MGARTRLYSAHKAAGAKLIDFGGWDMPLHYRSQIDEHHAVRNAAGVFDVSHMTVVDANGPGAGNYLRKLLANDVGRLNESGHGLYSCMLNESGGVVDDLIAYKLANDCYRIIVNAATRDKDLDWMQTQSQFFDVEVTEQADKIMLAVQGPAAIEHLGKILPGIGRRIAAKRAFDCIAVNDLFIARTGYTGEDGVELVTDPATGERLWNDLLGAGVRPCGLGARDTLRLEAGLNLYGQDMDEQVSPFEAGLSWTIAFEPADRRFIGRQALERHKANGVKYKFVGLILEDRGIMRHGQTVSTDAGEGIITSGGFSPTMQVSIALARVPAGASGGCEVHIRKDSRRALIVKPPFVRQGKVLVERPG